jgi:hypothetical protein
MTANLITRERAQRNLAGYAPTAAETTALDAQIAAVSSAIVKFCKREFVARSYDELYNGQGERRLFLRRYPILQVQSVRYRPVTVLKVINNDQATNQQARVIVQSTGLWLTRTAAGVVFNNQLLYSGYPTLQALANAITALGNGWSAQVVGNASGDYGLWPAQDLFVPSTFSENFASQGALTARGQNAELKMHTLELAGYQWDARGWLLRAIPYTDPELLHPEDLIWPVGIGNFRVQYTAGFPAVPEEIQEACAQWVAALFWQAKRDPGLSSHALAGATAYAPFSTMPPGVLEVLLPYRDHKVLILGD